MTSLRGAYHCTNCGAERDKEIRRMTQENVLELTIVYECGSFREMRRIGASWKHVGDVFKCGHLTNRKVAA